ncbi:MAG: hypothetical protein ABEJ60_06930 [Halodesulfurarchaeum sp.]
MSLSDIARGLTTTRTQDERGVAVVDRTGTPLETILEEFAPDLPCGADPAAALVTSYLGGASVGDAATAAGVPKTTAAKALHRLGFEGLSPLSPLQRDLCADWLAGELGRIEARELAGAGDREFALGAYVQSHDPIPGANEAIEDALSTAADAMVEKRDALADTMTAAGDLR